MYCEGRLGAGVYEAHGGAPRVWSITRVYGLGFIFQGEGTAKHKQAQPEVPTSVFRRCSALKVSSSSV